MRAPPLTVPEKLVNQIQTIALEKKKVKYISVLINGNIGHISFWLLQSFLNFRITTSTNRVVYCLFMAKILKPHFSHTMNIHNPPSTKSRCAIGGVLSVMHVLSNDTYFTVI